MLKVLLLEGLYLWMVLLFCSWNIINAHKRTKSVISYLDFWGLSKEKCLSKKHGRRKLDLELCGDWSISHELQQKQKELTCTLLFRRKHCRFVINRSMMNLRRTKSQVKYSLLYLYYLDMQQKYLEVYALVLIDTYLIKKAICIAVLK